jgi:esterase
VGVGLGASIGLLVASLLGDQIRKLVLVDAVPGLGYKVVTRPRSVAADSVASFTSVLKFSDFDELFERARQYSPGRSDAALRRGLEHNAVQEKDGSWSWRWDPGHRDRTDYEPEVLEQALDAYRGSILVVAGGASDVVGPEAIAELSNRHADIATIAIPGAEHGVQGTHPLQLAAVMQSFMDS